MDEQINKDFITYEYKEVQTESSHASFMLDCYENFGWKQDTRQGDIQLSSNTGQKVILRLKRNRKIINRTELTRLQRNFEACVTEIQALEKNKTSKASMYALIMGVIGTGFLALSTFAITGQPQHLIACIVFAVPGLAGWIFPYFIYRNVKKKQTQKVNPMIEMKKEEIYQLCEKGHKLL